MINKYSLCFYILMKSASLLMANPEPDWAKAITYSGFTLL